MAISRSLMNRQLRASGGIMDVTPRENFGFGSSLKKFVRKIIPNEISEIAVKAAPFVAPFNPALAGVMSGVGTFDQTGSISSGLKSGAMNYGGGQLARYAGGAGFQGNPFGDGGAFTGGLQGFKGGFSSPIGTETGLGKFFSNRGTEAVQGIDSGRAGDSASALSRSTANVPTEALASEVSFVPGGTEALANASDPLGSLIIDELSLVPNAINKTTVAKEPGFLKNMFDGISNQDYGKVAQTIGDGAKKFGKAMFTNKDGSIDKAAVLGAVAFTASYAEAKALAADAGVEITPEEYDESRKAEKQEEYAGYLTNFFGGQKDGGRIGYEGGANELIKDKLMEDIMPDTSTEEMIMIMTETGPKMIKKSDYEAMSGMFRDTTTSLYGDAARGRPVPEFANGGRIGYARGTPDTTMFEELNTDTIYRPEPESTITLPEEMPGDDKMAGSQGYDEQYNAFIELRDTFHYREGDSYSEANRKAKQIVYGMKDGGRIGFNDGGSVITLMDGTTVQIPDGAYDNGTFKDIIYSSSKGDLLREEIVRKLNFAKGGRVDRRFGSPEEGEGSGVMEMLSVDVDAGNDEEEENMTMAYEPGNFTNVQKSYMYRRLAGMGGKDRSITMPDLYKIFKNPGKYPADEAVIQVILEANGYKNGGRIGLKDGTGGNRVSQLLILRDEALSKGEDTSIFDAEIFQLTGKTFKSIGGISDIPTGEPRLNAGGVAERDYRQTGGFVPVGIKERADDVPAMLSKNEFVMTADSVRGLGNGSVEEGSKKLYNTMKQAEQKGKIA